MACALCNRDGTTEQYLGGEWHEGCLIGLPSVAAGQLVSLRKQLAVAEDDAPHAEERERLALQVQELRDQAAQASARADAATTALEQLELSSAAEIADLRNRLELAVSPPAPIQVHDEQARAELASALAELSSLKDKLAGTVPRDDYDKLVRQAQANRAHADEVRAQLADASAELERLQRQPDDSPAPPAYAEEIAQQRHRITVLESAAQAAVQSGDTAALSEVLP